MKPTEEGFRALRARAEASEGRKGEKFKNKTKKKGKAGEMLRGPCGVSVLLR